MAEVTLDYIFISQFSNKIKEIVIISFKRAQVFRKQSKNVQRLWCRNNFASPRGRFEIPEGHLETTGRAQASRPLPCPLKSASEASPSPHSHTQHLTFITF